MFGPPPPLPPSNSSAVVSSTMHLAGGISGGSSAVPAAPDSSANLRETITAAVNWRCGHAEYDTYISNLALPPDILQSLSQVDQASRMKMFRSTWQTKPDYPISWLEKCLERHQTSKGAGRATPYQREKGSGLPPAKQTMASAAAAPIQNGISSSMQSPASSHISASPASATHPAAITTRGRAEAEQNLVELHGLLRSVRRFIF